MDTDTKMKKKIDNDFWYPSDRATSFKKIQYQFLQLLVDPFSLESEIRSWIQSFSLFLPLISIDRSILIYDAEKGRLRFERKTFAFLRRRPR